MGRVNSRLVGVGLMGLVAATLAAIPGAQATPISLGVASDYAILYEGTGGHNLSISNDTVNGSIGVGGTGAVQFSGPGTITGQLDFSAANTGQYHNTNGSNIGPTSVVYSEAAVTTALSDINSLSSSISGGTNVAFTNAGETINESTGVLETIKGVISRVFNVTAYSASNASVLTVDGDGSGDPVVFNFTFNSNVNLGGSVAFGGSGLTSPDQLLFNFQSSGQNIDLQNNGETFMGIILAPDDAMSADNTNLDGRFFGGGSSDMQFVSGANITAPPPQVPEPASLALFGSGLVGALVFRRRRRKLCRAP